MRGAGATSCPFIEATNMPSFTASMMILIWRSTCASCILRPFNGTGGL